MRRMIFRAACAVSLFAITGCGQARQSSPTTRASDGVYAVQIETQSVSTLPACNSKTAGETAIVTSSHSLLACEAGVWLPILCTVGGTVAFNSATDSLWACTRNPASGPALWEQITLPRGPQGDAGPTGPQGATGPRGQPAKIQITHEDPGTNCPAGGQRIDVGAQTDAGFQIQQTAYVCNPSSQALGVGACSADADCDDENVCTVDTCSSGQCAHAMAPATTLCRPADGECDVAEHCTGNGTVCPADVYSTAVCHEAAGPCDIQRRCTGKSTLCPTGGAQPASHVCRAAQACSSESKCDGVSTDCPPPQFTAAGTVCSAGSACITQGTCDGTTGNCNSQVLANGTSCGSSAFCTNGSCVSCGGLAEECCGGTTCGDNLECSGGQCVCGNTGEPCCDGTTCDSGDACVNGTCQCGQVAGGPCCPITNTCGSNLACLDLTCKCGTDLSPCCGGTSCGANLTCTTAQKVTNQVGPICHCGDEGEACCNGNYCNNALDICDSGVCQFQ